MKTALTLILLLLGCLCFAQERHLISSTSFTHQSDYKFTISIGEPIIGLLSGSKITLSQGFIPINTHQLPTNIDNRISAIEIYPNPISSTIFIKGIDLNKEYSYLIVASSGCIIERNKLTKLQIQTSQLTPGSYILTIFNNESTFKQKLIKQ
jgi:hypothetical protein